MVRNPRCSRWHISEGRARMLAAVAGATVTAIMTTTGNQVPGYQSGSSRAKTNYATLNWPFLPHASPRFARAIIHFFRESDEF